MQRFGKMASIGVRRSASAPSSLDLNSASRAFDSIADILDIPSASTADVVATKPAGDHWLDLLEAAGTPVAVKDLAAQVSLPTQELAKALVTAGDKGEVSFLRDAEGTTFVQREKL
mgnify:CR=1 FL=1